MALRVTKTTDKVMFGPVEDWGKNSILVSGGRQYTVEEYSKWVNHGKFQDLQAASQRTQDLKSFGEVDRLDFESRGLAEETLDLEFESSWLMIRNGMAMQEREVPDNVTVQTQESEDDSHRYKSVEATVAGVPVIDHWKTPKAQRIRVVLPSSPDPLTGSYRIQPTTPTPAAKKPRYTGPSGSTGPSGVNRRLSFKVEEEDKRQTKRRRSMRTREGSYWTRKQTKWTTKTKSQILKMRRLLSLGPGKQLTSCRLPNSGTFT